MKKFSTASTIDNAINHLPGHRDWVASVVLRDRKRNADVCLEGLWGTSKRSDSCYRVKTRALTGYLSSCKRDGGCTTRDFLDFIEAEAR